MRKNKKVSILPYPATDEPLTQYWAIEKKEGEHSDLHCNRCTKTITLDGYSSVLPPKMLNSSVPKKLELELLGESIFSRGVRLVNFVRIYFWASPFFSRGVGLVINFWASPFFLG